MTARKILITGASSGFGLLTTQLLTARGHSVLAGVRGGEARAKSIPGFPLGPLVHVIDLDVTSDSHHAFAAEWIRDNWGGQLDVLIHNAGYGLLGPAMEISDSEMRAQFDTNFFGLIRLTQVLFPALKKARGRILSVSSIAGRTSFPFYGLYSASKHALEGFSEALHYELRPYGVQVGLIEPGGFRTDFNSRSLKTPAFSDKPEAPYFDSLKDFQKLIDEKSAFGGNPLRVAELIVKRCEQPVIPLRSPIGIDAKALLLAKWLLPEWLRLKLIGFGFWSKMRAPK